MEGPGNSSAESRQPATASQTDATVHITTRSPAPVSNAAAQVVTAKYQDSWSHQHSSNLVPKDLKLPAVIKFLPIADASQSAAVDVAADNRGADLQNINNSSSLEPFQQYNSLSAQDDIGIAAASDGPALTQTSSDRAQQLESSIVIDDVETMSYDAEQAGTGVSMPPGTTFGNAMEGSILSDPPDVMQTSYAYGEHEASLCCCFLVHKVYNAPNMMQTKLVHKCRWLHLCQAQCRQPQMQICSRYHISKHGNQMALGMQQLLTQTAI